MAFNGICYYEFFKKFLGSISGHNLPNQFFSSGVILLLLHVNAEPYTVKVDFLIFLAPKKSGFVSNSKYSCESSPFVVLLL